MEEQNFEIVYAMYAVSGDNKEHFIDFDSEPMPEELGEIIRRQNPYLQYDYLVIEKQFHRIEDYS